MIPTAPPRAIISPIIDNSPPRLRLDSKEIITSPQKPTTTPAITIQDGLLHQMISQRTVSSTNDPRNSMESAKDVNYIAKFHHDKSNASPDPASKKYAQPCLIILLISCR